MVTTPLHDDTGWGKRGWKDVLVEKDLIVLVDTEYELAVPR